MDRSLEELRAQRELIKTHLDWLDRQIAKSTESPHSAPAEAQVKKTNEPDKQAKESSELELTADDILKQAPTSSVKSAQQGCLIIAFIATALFLFGLFGLPYLLD